MASYAGANTWSGIGNALLGMRSERMENKREDERIAENRAIADRAFALSVADRGGGVGDRPTVTVPAKSFESTVSDVQNRKAPEFGNLTDREPTPGIGAAMLQAPSFADAGRSRTMETPSARYTQHDGFYLPDKDVLEDESYRRDQGREQARLKAQAEAAGQVIPQLSQGGLTNPDDIARAYEGGITDPELLGRGFEPRTPARFTPEYNAGVAGERRALLGVEREFQSPVERDPTRYWVRNGRTYDSQNPDDVAAWEADTGGGAGGGGASSNPASVELERYNRAAAFLDSLAELGQNLAKEQVSTGLPNQFVPYTQRDYDRDVAALKQQYAIQSIEEAQAIRSQGPGASVTVPNPQASSSRPFFETNRALFEGRGGGASGTFGGTPGLGAAIAGAGATDPLAERRRDWDELARSHGADWVTQNIEPRP